MFDYAGCIHFHSNYSYDARTPMEAIVRNGILAGLQFAIVTDHFGLKARTDGWERYHEIDGKRMLLMVGEEISPRYNHYLALDLKTPIIVWKNEAAAQKIINAVAEQGGFGFIAHPDHEGAPLLGSRAFPWIDWNVTGFSGLGIWDLLSDWSSSLTSPLNTLHAAFFPEKVLRGPNRKTLARWDRLAQTGHCVGIGEVDNHAQHKNIFGFSRHIFPFDFAFRTIRTHVVLNEPLVGDAPGDQARLLQAIRLGRSFISLDFWRNAAGFSFEIFDGRKRSTMGQEFMRQGPALLEAKLPSEGRFRLIRNGEIIFEERKRPHIERDVELPGVYRVEVDHYAAGRWRPWIYSNPVWVT